MRGRFVQSINWDQSLGIIQEFTVVGYALALKVLLMDLVLDLSAGKLNLNESI